MDPRLDALKQQVKSGGWEKQADGSFTKVKGDPFVGGAPEQIVRPKRLRQDPRPALNKLEADWRNYIKALSFPGAVIHEQALRFKLANGAWYKPDLAAWLYGWWYSDILAFALGRKSEDKGLHYPDLVKPLVCWECKGPKEMKNVARGMLALKAAAHQFPEVLFVLVWREGGAWRTQAVLP